MSAYSTPGPMCRVRWVPRRSGNSVCGIAVAAVAQRETPRPRRRRPCQSRPVTHRAPVCRPGPARVAAPSIGRRRNSFQVSGGVVDHLDPQPVHGRNRDVHLHVVGFRNGRHAQLRLLAFKASLQSGLTTNVNLRHRPLPADRTQHAEQRRCERDQLPARSDHGSDERHPCTGRNRKCQRRCAPTQLGFDAAGLDHDGSPVCPRARGTGKRRNSSATTSEP